eukprot:6201254-Pleurochrysis_carterae.AAC.1
MHAFQRARRTVRRLEEGAEVRQSVLSSVHARKPVNLRACLQDFVEAHVRGVVHATTLAKAFAKARSNAIAIAKACLQAEAKVAAAKSKLAAASAAVETTLARRVQLTEALEQVVVSANTLSVQSVDFRNASACFAVKS